MTDSSSQAGFSLIEILTALAIVSISLVMLIESNATAMKAVHLARRTSQATLLAQDSMERALAVVDVYGFGENDVEDKGDFQRQYPGEYPGWTWEWSLAKTKFKIPDLSGFMDQAGVDGQVQDAAMGGQEAGGLASMIDPQMFEEMMGNYIREVRVTVCYPTGKKTKDCIELVSHVTNPGGSVVAGEEQQVVLDQMGGGNLPDIMEMGE